MSKLSGGGGGRERQMARTRPREPDRESGHGRLGAVPPIHPFVPQTRDALPLELQRLNMHHLLHRMGLHGHAFYELIYVERGGGPHRLGSAQYPTETGSCFVIPPGELHDCSAIGPDLEGWVLLFSHEALDGIAAKSRAYAGPWPSAHPLLSPFFRLGRAGAAPLRVSPSDHARWSERFCDLERELEARTHGYRFAVHALFNLLLLDLVRLSGDPAVARPDPRDMLMSEAFGFIERRFAEPISAADVARAVQRSAAYLTTVMRRRTGLTAGEWIAERRMAEARRLLAATALDLDAIADRAGYSDRGSFARAFRRAHLVTPTLWRQSHRGQPPYA